MKPRSCFRFSRRAALLAIPFLLAGASLVKAADPFEDIIRKTDPLPPGQERTRFHLPPGFEIQLVAAEPDIGKPMNMAFDAQGRLWITQSREYPYAAPLDKPGRDMIKVLSDFGADGRARKVVTFAEGLNIPIGLYPYKNGVVAFSIPNIYYFQDTDGDGRSDKKELILGRFGFEKDVHGLTSAFRRGFDGWVYADHGFNNDTTLTARDGSTIKMNSGNTYRFRIDGSRVEQFTHGQVNPFGLMFDPFGDLWSADCHSAPVYQLLRGGWYPSFGKPHDGLGFGPDICDHLHGSTAIAGMVYYAADDFPPEYRGNVFVGNVMTCRINRDSLVEHGSTRIAKEESDFLSSDDPWFRPDDLQLGPDGAIYVSDFYNRIIGHYEVALDHPGRDRERGRIWRIIYRGGQGAPISDLSRASIQELITALASQNITRRMLVMNELVDSRGTAAAAPVAKMMGEKASAGLQKAHGLWVLHRLGALNEKVCSSAARDGEPLVRVHAMRILSETTPWSQRQDGFAVAGLLDKDPYVQRAAADALGRHPALGHVRPLLDLRAKVPADDAQLLYTVRMALRDQLVPEGTLTRLQNSPLSEADSRAIADVAPGLKSPEVGQFLLQHLQRFSESANKLSDYLRHAARYAPAAQTAQLAALARTKFPDDLDFQLTLFKSIQEGVKQRGEPLAPEFSQWGAELAERLLSSVDSKALDWHNSPMKGRDPTNPWFLQKRASADGDKNSWFVCSLPPGGERFTGILRSKAFVIPPKLSFYLAGHDGYPDKPAQKQNLVRLRSAATQEILATTPAPRNDLAQLSTWDLSGHANESGYLEVIDGDTGAAFAWLAIGRINPPVINLPAMSPRDVDERQRAAAELAASLRLTGLDERLKALAQDQDADTDARAAALKTVVAGNAEPSLGMVRKILFDAEEPAKLREAVAAVLGESGSALAKNILVEAFGTAPLGLQTKLGLALASSSAGAEALLQAVSDGKASARLLQDRNIKDRLAATKIGDFSTRIEKLTANLPRANEERQKLIDARSAAFDVARASAALGMQTFKQHCAICHSLDGQGPVIGPQLDGVGGRGAERLIEDILDPNRNVDRAFRTTLLVLKDGDVQSGLFRREEGEMLVLADSTAKEISVAKKDVKERRESETSLMPDNFGDVIPAEDFKNLVAYLLSKGGKSPKAEPNATNSR